MPKKIIYIIWLLALIAVLKIYWQTPEDSTADAVSVSDTAATQSSS